jgi:hypothetical protein
MDNYESSPYLESCLFYENQADDDGAGMHNDDDSYPGLANCTFVENAADGKGGGICNRGGSRATLYNCIFWDNTADDGGNEVYNSSTSDAWWSYSDIEGCGGSGGGWDPNCGSDYGNNIDDDPDFDDDGDPEGIDNVWGTCDDGLSLDSSSSPCVDTGYNVCVLGTDLCGKDRTIDGDNDNVATVDMGAYEYEP